MSVYSQIVLHPRAVSSHVEEDYFPQYHVYSFMTADEKNKFIKGLTNQECKSYCRTNKINAYVSQVSFFSCL